MMPASPTAPAALGEYPAKRDFGATPEPAPARASRSSAPIFVVQEHHATRLHYGFRLEADGVLKSWAVTNEPSLDPVVKRLAVRVEDHPVSYAGFSGTIPAGQYGAGEVRVWDRGTFEALDPPDVAAGKLSFALHGDKLNGRFSLVRMRGGQRKRENWLLIKGRDEYARRTTAAPIPRDEAKPTRPAVRSPSVIAPGEVEVTDPEKVL